MAIIPVPFTALWAVGSLWAIYGSQIATGTFDPTSSLAGIPFLLGSLVLLWLVPEWETSLAGAFRRGDCRSRYAQSVNGRRRDEMCVGYQASCARVLQARNRRKPEARISQVGSVSRRRIRCHNRQHRPIAGSLVVDCEHG